MYFGSSLAGCSEKLVFPVRCDIQSQHCQVATLGSLSKMWNPLQACCLACDPQGLILLIWQGFDLGNTSRDFFVCRILLKIIDIGFVLFCFLNNYHLQRLINLL